MSKQESYFNIYSDMRLSGHKLAGTDTQKTLRLMMEKFPKINNQSYPNGHWVDESCFLITGCAYDWKCREKEE